MAEEKKKEITQIDLNLAVNYMVIKRVLTCLSIYPTICEEHELLPLIFEKARKAEIYQFYKGLSEEQFYEVRALLESLFGLNDNILFGKEQFNLGIEIPEDAIELFRASFKLLLDKKTYMADIDKRSPYYNKKLVAEVEFSDTFMEYEIGQCFVDSTELNYKGSVDEEALNIFPKILEELESNPLKINPYGALNYAIKCAKAKGTKLSRKNVDESFKTYLAVFALTNGEVSKKYKRNIYSLDSLIYSIARHTFDGFCGYKSMGETEWRALDSLGDSRVGLTAKELYITDDDFDLSDIDEVIGDDDLTVYNNDRSEEFISQMIPRPLILKRDSMLLNLILHVEQLEYVFTTKFTEPVQSKSIKALAKKVKLSLNIDGQAHSIDKQIQLQASRCRTAYAKYVKQRKELIRQYKSDKIKNISETLDSDDGLIQAGNNLKSESEHFYWALIEPLWTKLSKSAQTELESKADDECIAIQRQISDLEVLKDMFIWADWVFANSKDLIDLLKKQRCSKALIEDMKTEQKRLLQRIKRRKESISSKEREYRYSNKKKKELLSKIERIKEELVQCQTTLNNLASNIDTEKQSIETDELKIKGILYRLSVLSRGEALLMKIANNEEKKCRVYRDFDIDSTYSDRGEAGIDGDEDNIESNEE